MYVNNRMGISEISRIRRAMSSTVRRVVPARRARSDPRWITGPSAIGSENGTPSSIRSAPPRSSAATIRAVYSGEGSPAVMYAIRPARPSPLSRSNNERIRVGGIQLREVLSIDICVFVATAGNINYEDLVFRLGRLPDRFRHCMRGFESRKDALGARQQSGGLKRLRVASIHIFRPPSIMQPRMLRSDQRVVEARRNGVRQRNLAVVVLEQVAVGAMQHPGRAA